MWGNGTEDESCENLVWKCIWTPSWFCRSGNKELDFLNINFACWTQNCMRGLHLLGFYLYAHPQGKRDAGLSTKILIWCKWHGFILFTYLHFLNSLALCAYIQNFFHLLFKYLFEVDTIMTTISQIRKLRHGERGLATCPKSHSPVVEELGNDPNQSDSRTSAPNTDTNYIASYSFLFYKFIFKRNISILQQSIMRLK